MLVIHDRKHKEKEWSSSDNVSSFRKEKERKLEV